MFLGVLEKNQEETRREKMTNSVTRAQDQTGTLVLLDDEATRCAAVLLAHWVGVFIRLFLGKAVRGGANTWQSEKPKIILFEFLKLGDRKGYKRCLYWN